MRLGVYIMLMIAVFSVFSCRNRKQTGKTELKNLSYKNILDSLQYHEFQYEWLRSKGSAEILFNKEKHQIKSNFRVRKDSAIWNNLSKGPVQISTALLSKDSVKLLLKLSKKEYFLGDYQYINNLLKLDLEYDLLQNFLSGNPIMFDYEEKYISSVDSSMYLLSSNKSKKIDRLLRKGKQGKDDFFYRCWVNPENFKCAKVEVIFVESSTLINVIYDNWVDLEGQDYPLSAYINFQSPTDTVGLKIDYSDNIKINDPQSMPFKITDSYTPVKIDE